MEMGTEDGVTELDAVWRALKPWGKFQSFQLFLILLDFIPASFAILSAVFTGYIPEYVCDVPTAVNNATSDLGNVSFTQHQCSYDVYANEGNTSKILESRSCESYSFTNENSYAYQWNLVCSRSNLAALAQSLVLAGQGLGALIMSHLADRFGRKTVHVISHVGVFCSMIVMAFSQNIYMLLALRLITGTFQQGIVCTGKTLALEIFPREARAHTAPAGFITWGMGLMILSLYGFVFQDINWRYLQLAIAAFSLYALAEWWMMDESVRWLLSNGRLDEAKRILKKAARWNKVDYKEVESVLNESVNLTATETPEANLHEKEMKILTNGSMNHDEMESDMTIQTVKKYTVIDILKNPSLRVNTFILWYTWIVATGTYYGLTLVSSHLAGDRFINFFLSGVIEIPSQVISFCLLNRIGRKWTMILWYAISGISLIIATVLLTVFEDNEVAGIVATAFSLIGKSAITGSFSIVFLYTPEIYPTNYRNSGLGISSSISRIGGILAPFVSNLALIALWIPGAIFGGMCLLVVLLALRLPESATHELPTTIAECETWENNKNSDNKNKLL
ncbi:organic cation transporter protein-like isoform X1 [Mercenaria mercenaria]|uniref:organic cation transporter protein-like isoform X1 n=1 Tax=Mercenaria mercenaria TaxID=6596 RepID=UPI00234EDB3A|nr:organic cation transporter protein-like isoform X1 [Mercenaria mercenaria]XP_045215874.2 organic cation transporter protein-like isoform X1 [Mercenaria mercenaria]